ncbi:response regulator, partial [Methylobacterium organophilum]|nr:response regulator [Methylobacterium organophilum]
MATDLVHVVDDDPAMRDSVAFLLGTEGFAVQLYEAGSDLLNRLAKPATGCILADIRMPGIDGLELLRRLRGAKHRLPIVMMTGHGDVPLAVEAMKLGACDFIEKPFDDETLFQALRSALERGGPAAAEDPGLQEFVRRVETLSTRERQVLDQLVAGIGGPGRDDCAEDLAPDTGDAAGERLGGHARLLRCEEVRL